MLKINERYLSDPNVSGPLSFVTAMCYSFSAMCYSFSFLGLQRLFPVSQLLHYISLPITDLFTSLISIFYLAYFYLKKLLVFEK